METIVCGLILGVAATEQELRRFVVLACGIILVLTYPVLFTISLTTFIVVKCSISLSIISQAVGRTVLGVNNLPLSSLLDFAAPQPSPNAAPQPSPNAAPQPSPRPQNFCAPNPVYFS